MTEHEVALKEWLDRTEWVQKTALPHELGLHRAEVLRLRIESRDKKIKELQDKIDRLVGDGVLYYEMPGGIRFPVGKITEIGSKDD